MNLLQTTAYQNLPWEHDVLEMVAQASQTLGIEAWGSTGLFYRPFLNGKYGPSQASTDKDVCVKTTADVKVFAAYLRSRYPAVRWSVFSGDKENAEYGVPSPYWAIQAGRPISLRLGAVRKLASGEVQVLSFDTVLASLEKGQVEVNDLAHQASIAAGTEAAFLRSAASRKSLLLGDYPGLGIDGAGIPRLAGSPTNRLNRPYLHAMPHPELEVVAALKRQVDDNPDFPQPSLPQPSLPAGVGSWAEVAFQANDASFREWFLNQVRSRNPIGGRDAYVADTLKGYEGQTVEDTHKDLHWGWDVQRHIREALLALSTDSMTSVANLKASARLAMFLSYSQNPVVPSWGRHDVIERLREGFHAYAGAVASASGQSFGAGNRFAQRHGAATILKRLSHDEYGLVEAMWQAEVGTVPLLASLYEERASIGHDVARQARGL